MGTTPIQDFATKYYHDWKGVRCTLWHSENEYTDEAEHVYTIVRDPKHIIISMYFHCTQSTHSREGRRRKMPDSLGAWLDAWVEAIGNETKVQENSKFACPYNPINFQSRYTHFDVNSSEGKDEDDLKQRFDIIGDTAQMAKSICAIFIRYTDGWVPSQCNCTASSSSSSSRRSVVTAYNASVDAHGVQNHGATFQTTPRQDEQIAKLGEMDVALYEVVKGVFAEQIKEIEEEYQIRLCDQFRK
jgi:hypothetical protein